MLRIESSERIPDQRELIVGAAKLPHNLMRPAIHFDNGAKISIRNNHPAVEIKINGVRVIQIGNEWRRDRISRAPVLVTRDQRIDFSGGADSQYLVNCNVVRRTAPLSRAVELAKVVAK